MSVRESCAAILTVAREVFNADFRGRENNQSSDACHGQR
jgi:hypothetical protein